MAKEKIIPIQFQEPLVKEIEDYVKNGLYSSKAEFVREAVRKLIIELRKETFFLRMANLGKKAKIKSPFLTKRQKDKIFEELKKEAKTSITREALKS